MNEETKPDDFDWVTARARCSIESVFKILAKIVERDVERANALLKDQFAEYSFSGEERMFRAIRKTDWSGITDAAIVTFKLSASGINVTQLAKASQGLSKPMFTATPTLTIEGECILNVNGEALRLWQVSRRALEELLFQKS